MANSEKLEEEILKNNPNIVRKKELENEYEEYEGEYSEDSDEEEELGEVNYSKLSLNNKKQPENFEEDQEEDEVEENQENSYAEEDEESEGTDEELLREYEKIKKMREDEKKTKELENAEKIKKHAEEQILLGNPLVNVSGYSLKKKWFEDTVFKNQSKNDVKIKKRFVNDTVRSDFHRKFLSKSIQ